MEKSVNAPWVPDDVNWPWDPGLTEKLKTLSQGFVIKDLEFGFYGDARTAASKVVSRSQGASEAIEIFAPKNQPDFMIITTQTCDLAEDEEKSAPQNPFFMAAPVYLCDHFDEKLQFTIDNFGVFHRIHLTGKHFSEGYYVADLRVQVPYDKGVLLARPAWDGFKDEEDRARFASRVAGIYDRPALPNAICDHITNPLREFFNKRPPRRELFRNASVQEIRIGVAGDPPTATYLLIIVTDLSKAEELRRQLQTWCNVAIAALKKAGIDFTGLRMNAPGFLSASEYHATKPIALPFLEGVNWGKPMSQAFNEENSPN